MKLKLASIFLCLLLFLPATLTGCDNKEKSEIYFLNSKPELAAAYNEIARKYENETGVKVKVVTADSDNYGQTLKTELTKSDAPTVFVINDIKDYGDLSGYYLDIKDSKIYSRLADKTLALGKNGEVHALPLSVKGHGLLYNKTLFEKYFALKDRKSNINSIKEIKGFSDFKSVVEDMTAKKAELGIKGVFAGLPLSENDDWRWQMNLINIPLYYEYNAGDLFEGSAFDNFDFDNFKTKYSEKIKNLLDLYLDNSTVKRSDYTKKTVADSIKEFAEEEAVIIPSGNFNMSDISSIDGNKLKSADIGILPIYTGIDGEGSQGLLIETEDYLALNKNIDDEQKEATLKFIDWLFSSESGKELVKEGLKTTPPFETFEETDFADDFTKSEALRYLKDDSIKNIPLVFNEFGEKIKSGISEILTDYARGMRKWNDSIENMIEKWKNNM